MWAGLCKSPRQSSDGGRCLTLNDFNLLLCICPILIHPIVVAVARHHDHCCVEIQRKRPECDGRYRGV